MKTTLKFAAATSLLAATSHAASILLVDDSRGLPVQDAWVETLTNLGHSITVEAILSTGNVTSDMSSFDLVIWTVGDQAYDNLSTANWDSMTAHVAQGGKLLYVGGHSVYEETVVGYEDIEALFGVSATHHNMPEWNGPTTVSGTGNSAEFGTSTYGVQSWAGGEYSNMGSAFDVTTAIPLVNQPDLNRNSPGPYTVAHNAANNTQLWGIDLNQIVPEHRSAFLSAALAVHGIASVPEPSSVLLIAGAGLLALGRRRRA